MALVLGINCGFVTTAPTENPSSSTELFYVRDRCHAMLNISPSAAIKITEMGWWCNDATEEANFEIGIYADGGNNEPELLISKDDINAKGTTSGWKRATGLNFSISPNTNYWITVQLDHTATTTRTRSKFDSSVKNASLYLVPQTTLPNDWGTSDWKSTYLFAVYAVWEARWSPILEAYINIGDIWKRVSELYINVGDAWKSISEKYLQKT